MFLQFDIVSSEPSRDIIGTKDVNKFHADCPLECPKDCSLIWHSGRDYSPTSSSLKLRRAMIGMTFMCAQTCSDIFT